MDVCYYQTQNKDLFITEFGYSAPQSRRVIGPRVRDTYILHFVFEGVCNFSGFNVQAGEAFLIAKERLHRFEVLPPYRHFWLAFDGHLAETLLTMWNIAPDRHMRFQVKHFETAANVIQTAFHACRNGSPDDSVAKSVLLFTLPLLAVCGETTVLPVEIAAQFMERHYVQKITLQQVAEAVHWSEKHLCKKFKEQFGIPPQRYLMQIRMQRAMALLLHTDLQIQEVALSVGFSSSLAFSAAFQKFAGVSPRAYRQTGPNQAQ